ncbi:MAG TPA: hydantoinase/oxoprolinase family protein [bacterium]|nr:hydantoinase/oxoprolinase family protein [bacterium]
MAAGTYRLGLDIGGTFTDVVLLHEPTGDIRTHKVLTTPRDPADGALRSVREICAAEGIDLRQVGILIHATTLVTNAIIERKGARTGLLTTAGFRDTLEVGKEQRYDIYDLFLRYPDPLVPRRWRLDVPERITRNGEVRRAVDLRAARRLVGDLVRQGVEAIAVSFLHAYKNPDHERQVKALIEREFPHLAVCISSEVSPEIREYERTSTTVANAYVLPLVDGYLRHMETALADEGFTGRFLLMLSSGTLAAPEVARAYPVRLLESGPAAGALMAGHIGMEIGRSEVVSFDMGGTTAKISLVRKNRPKITPAVEVARVHRFKPGSGLPVKTPVVDMIEIGAGGGSIARVGSMGLLRVGPESAGADPGPACYALGGTDATVTDACVVLGYFDPGAFLGGTMPLDAAAAREAVARAGRPLGLDAIQTAWGIVAIVCEHMAQAARLYLIERGQDPRRFALMGFGGAGPATAGRVARALGMREVIIPPASGVASAVGLLVAAPGVDLGHSLAGELQELDWRAVEELFTSMESRGREMIAGTGERTDGIRVERRAEMRYAGQFHDIEIPIARPLPSQAAHELRTRFDTEYERLYGVTLDGYPVQALNWRVLVTGRAPRVDISVASPKGSNMSPRRRSVFLPDQGTFVEVPVYQRYALTSGAHLIGPVIVEESEATTVVWPGDELAVDARQNLIITTAGSGADA